MLVQSIAQSAPHETLQFGPLLQANVQLSPHVALQSLPKLEHVGAQLFAVPQSRLQTPPEQSQRSVLHVGESSSSPHATTSPMVSAVTTTRRGIRRTGMPRWYPATVALAAPSSPTDRS